MLSLWLIYTARKVDLREILNTYAQTGSGSDQGLKTGYGSDHILIRILPKHQDPAGYGSATLVLRIDPDPVFEIWSDPYPVFKTWSNTDSVSISRSKIKNLIFLAIFIDQSNSTVLKYQL